MWLMKCCVGAKLLVHVFNMDLLPFLSWIYDANLLLLLLFQFKWSKLSASLSLNARTLFATVEILFFVIFAFVNTANTIKNFHNHYVRLSHFIWTFNCSFWCSMWKKIHTLSPLDDLVITMFSIFMAIIILAINNVFVPFGFCLFDPMAESFVAINAFRLRHIDWYWCFQHNSNNVHFSNHSMVSMEKCVFVVFALA